MSTEPFFFTWSAQSDAVGVEIVGGEGAWFDTASGDRWLDFLSLTYHVNLGHGRTRMVEAVREQAERLCVTMPKAVFPEKRALATRLLELAGPGFSKVFFTLGGADANENAIKMARMVTGRHKVVSRYRSYHGGTLGALSLTGDYRRPPLEPLLPGALRVLDCDCYRCPFGKTVDVCETECASQIGDVLRFEQNVAAVFLEPVPGANGVLVPPDDYWPRVRAACDARGALLVADEVLCGFGRTGRWFGHQHWGVTPDLITVSKGITGGYGVLGAVIVHERVAKHFEDRALLAGLTQYAHPLGIRAALEAIAIYEEESLIERSARMGPKLLRGLAQLGAPLSNVRGLGLLAGADLELDESGCRRLGRALADQHLHAYVRPSEGTLVLAPPLCLTDDDLEEGLRRIGEALAAVR